MEPLFAVAKIIGSPGRYDILLFHSKLFKCDYDHCSTVAFGNARITLWRKNMLCELDIWLQ